MGLRERIFGFESPDNSITVELVPIDTAPISEALLMQPEASFDLKYQIEKNRSYSGVLEFRTPDPFEIRNRGRPDSMEWDSNNQKILADQVKKDGRIQMKVVFPSQYRGQKSGQIKIIEQSRDVERKLREHPIVSDPPLIHTQS